MHTNSMSAELELLLHSLFHSLHSLFIKENHKEKSWVEKSVITASQEQKNPSVLWSSNNMSHIKPLQPINYQELKC